MKWPRVMFTQRRSSADHAVRRRRPAARRRNVFILKGLPGRRPYTEETKMTSKLPFAIVLVSLSVLWTSLHGANGDALQRQLIEGAKKESKLVFYTSVETEFARSLT